MMISKQSVWILALIAPAVGFRAASMPRDGEAIRFTLEEGASVSRTYELHGEYTTGLVEIDVSGMQVEVPDIELSATWMRSIEISDEFEKLRDGAPAVLLRSYDTIEHELECVIDIEGRELNHQEEGELPCESPLDGLEVRFEWNEDTEVYDKRALDDEFDSELLEGLVEDMDLRALLPEGEVEAGDSWEIDAEDFLAVLTPGGDLGVTLGRGEQSRGTELAISGLDPRATGSLDVMLGEPTGDCDVSATFEEVRELDGVRVAIIKIEASIVTQAEAFELYDLWMREYDPDEEEVSIELEQADLSFECTLEGELRWDLEAGRAHSMEFAGDSMLTLARSALVNVEGQEVGIEMELEMEGELTITASFE